MESGADGLQSEEGKGMSAKAFFIESKWENLPVCPNCGHKDQNWHDGLDSKGDGDSWEADCPSCGSGYTVTIHLVTKFDTANSVKDEGLSPNK